jgi:enamine deaminase RidA (YjgF/YER057c/UK114 family)
MSDKLWFVTSLEGIRRIDKLKFVGQLQREKQMGFKLINPESLGAPHGYSNGVLTEAGGRLLFIAGQVAWDQQQQIVSADLAEQFDRALANVIAVVTEAGGQPEQIARLIIYVTDKKEYKKRMKEIGEHYRARMGKHFPAMVLVEVAGLLEDRAQIEIEGMAML